MRIPKPVFVIIIVALSLSIVALSVIGIAFGFKSCSPIKNGSSESSKGEMLKLVLSPVDPGLATESNLDETKSALESRLDKTGINDYYVLDSTIANEWDHARFANRKTGRYIIVVTHHPF